MKWNLAKMMMAAAVLSMTACGFWPGHLQEGTIQEGVREEESQEMTADESEKYEPTVETTEETTEERVEETIEVPALPRSEAPSRPAGEDAQAVYDRLSDEERRELANLILPYLGPFTKGEEGSASYREGKDMSAVAEDEIMLFSAETGSGPEELPELSFVRVKAEEDCIEAQGAMEFRSQSGDFKGIIRAGFVTDPEEPLGFRLQRMDSKWIPLPISREEGQEDYEYDTGDLSGLFSPLVIYGNLIAETDDYWEFWAEAMEFSDGGGGGEITVNTIIRVRKDARVLYGPDTITAEEYLMGRDRMRVLWYLKQDEAGYIIEFQDMNAG